MVLTHYTRIRVVHTLRFRKKMNSVIADTGAFNRSENKFTIFSNTFVFLPKMVTSHAIFIISHDLEY